MLERASNTAGDSNITYTILPAPQKSGRTLIVYCILCSLNVLFKSVQGPIDPIPLLAIMCFFIFLHHDVRMNAIFVMGL